MEQNEEPRNKPKPIRSIHLQLRSPKCVRGKDQDLQYTVLIKLDNHRPNKETEPLPHTQQ